MTRLGLTVSAFVALWLQQPSMALVFAVLAIAWAPTGPTALRQQWEDSKRRADDS